jgi:hypothetical protein
MDLELKDKIALVTGASRGIGRAIARGLAAEGARVVLCARDKARLETAAAEIGRETRAEPVVAAGDLSRLEDVERVVGEVHGRFGRIDILVNNAGAIRDGDGTLGAAARPAGLRRRKAARAVSRRGRGDIPARADRSPRGRGRPRLLPRLRACVVPFRNLHHRGRRGHPRRLSLRPSAAAPGLGLP